MASVRWRKLRSDLASAPGRISLMVLALAISLVGFGAVLGARAVLQREITASYLSGRPADATIALPDGVDPALLAEVRARPEIAAAGAREVIVARISTTSPPPPPAHHGHLHGMAPTVIADAQSIQLFVEDDFAARQVNRLRSQSGAWPPPRGAMLIERTAVAVVGAGEGSTVTITTPHGAPRAIAIAGVVHDTALAPAWQEHRGFGYVTRATLELLGEPPVLHDLCVRFQPAPSTRADVEAAAAALATWLVAHGHAVANVRVPSLRQHPHEPQMRTVQLAFLVFSALLLVLSAILIATLLAALLARQAREIGVMKAIGARTGQLVTLYAALVGVIGALALVIAVPLGHHGAQAIIGAMAYLMNLAVDDPAIPGWVTAVQVTAGLAVPLAIAAIPIVGACRRTVRAALAHHGAREVIRVAPRWLPHAARNALRRPVRLALAISLLVLGGVMTMTAVNVKLAYERTVAQLPTMWHYDLELGLAPAAPPRAPAADTAHADARAAMPVDSTDAALDSPVLASALAAVPGVRVVEAWGSAAEAWPRADGIDLRRTYPDQGHGSFRVYGVPPATQLATLPLVAGRWLVAGDDDAIVLSTRSAPIGARVTLALDGVATTWTVVGIVDPLPAGNAFVSAAALARATHRAPRLFRIALAAGTSAAQATPALLAAATHAGAAVQSVTPFGLLRAAIDDHVVILTRAAILLAAIVALVGLLGLGAAMGIAVVERTREIGVLKAIGASDRRVLGLVVGEAVAIGVASWGIAALLVAPATYALDRALSRQGFLAATFVISPLAIAGWLAVVIAGSALASLLPARRAARLTVREALSET